jgi:hypothetical protein
MLLRDAMHQVSLALSDRRGREGMLGVLAFNEWHVYYPKSDLACGLYPPARLGRPECCCWLAFHRTPIPVM